MVNTTAAHYCWVGHHLRWAAGYCTDNLAVSGLCVLAARNQGMPASQLSLLCLVHLLTRRSGPGALLYCTCALEQAGQGSTFVSLGTISTRLNGLPYD